MKLIDYKCRYLNGSEAESSAMESSGLKFPEAHCNAKDIALLSKSIKSAQNGAFCCVPFCHTVEGEAMGATINLGDAVNGPRAKSYCCDSLEDLLSLPDIDVTTGRISEVIKASAQLKQEGEEVVLYLSGPFTILNVLIDPTRVFKTFRKEPEVMVSVFEKLEIQLLNYVQAMKNVGVTIVSYADSSGGLNILGPKFFEKTMEHFTVKFLKKLSDTLGDEGLIILCPKTTLGLISSGRASWGFVDVSPEITYQQAVIKAKGKVQIVGETCLKNTSYTVRHGKIRSVVL